MDDGGPTASIILFMILLFIDMLLYGFGMALQVMNHSDVEKKALEENDLKSIRLNKMIDQPEKYINTLQLMVTVVQVVIGGIYLPAGSLFLQKQFTMQEGAPMGMVGILSLLITATILIYMILTFGILIPKKIAAKYPEKWAYFFINPIYYIMKFLTPLTGMVTITSKGILRLFGIRIEEDNVDVTEEEIISMVNEGHEQGVLLASEAEMITNIFEFGDKEAQDIMTHRINIEAIDGTMPFKDAIHFMLQERNSRYPVYMDNIDHIIGIINLKDALRIHAGDEGMNCAVSEVKGLLREAQFIPETRNIDALFKTMQSMKIQMVIVVDEYGQTAGLVAMEDILEEIVGNILDEYDEDEAYIEDKGNNEYVIEGMTPLEELEEKFDIHFDEDEFDTLNGFLISKMDKIPDENEQFEITVDGYRFKVLSVENKMIHTVLVTKMQEQTIEDEDLT
ncbi:MAG: hemolysin family protein [Lachnospiraceae bacterium]|nr:hemolysin family protein [Lachnospiraceae bacterium]